METLKLKVITHILLENPTFPTKCFQVLNIRCSKGLVIWKSVLVHKMCSEDFLKKLLLLLQILPSQIYLVSLFFLPLSQDNSKHSECPPEG